MGDITYRVDGMNRRILRSKAGVTTDKFIWRSQLQPVLWEDRNGVQGRMVYALGRNVPAYMVTGGRMYRFITDHLGSVRLVCAWSRWWTRDEADARGPLVGEPRVSQRPLFRTIASRRRPWP